MKLQRFFIRETIGNKRELTLPDHKLAHQLRSVFRFKTGDTIILFDGSQYEYVSSITNLTSDKVSVTIKEKNVTCVTPKKNVHIFQSIIKKDNFEWILEKCTEIGVSEFTPVISERTEKKNLNNKRAQTIMIEASEQSGRCSVPVLNETASLASIITKYGENLIAFNLGGERFECEKSVTGNDVKVLIGPEGGWSEKEVELMNEVGIKVFSLGSQTLRAETAAIAVATLLLL